MNTPAVPTAKRVVGSRRSKTISISGRKPRKPGVLAPPSENSPLRVTAASSRASTAHDAPPSVERLMCGTAPPAASRR